MKGHPIFLDLAGQRVVVVGGGEVAERKVRGVLESGALVTVIAPGLTPQIEAWAGAARVEWVRRRYRPGDLAGARLVYAATDEPETNLAVAEESRAARGWVNIADQPALCDFYAPAVVRRGDLTIAVSTGGTSPALARRIREELEERFGPQFETALDELRALRDRARQEGRSPAGTRDAVERIIERLMPKR